MVTRLLTTVTGALLGAAPGWLIVRPAVANEPTTTRLALILGTLTIGALMGLIAGAAVGRRAWLYPSGITLFAGMAGVLSGGVVGAVVVGGVTAAYLFTYGQWPGDILGSALYVLAVPALTLTGWFAGALTGAICGLLGGTILRGTAVLRR